MVAYNVGHITIFVTSWPLPMTKKGDPFPLCLLQEICTVHESNYKVACGMVYKIKIYFINVLDGKGKMFLYR